MKSPTPVRLFATPWGIAYGLLGPWEFPGKSGRVDCRFLPQAAFPTQESNPGLPHCGQTLYRLSHQGSPNIYLATPDLSCNMQDLVAQPGFEPGSPALGVQSLSCWATREVTIDLICPN